MRDFRATNTNNSHGVNFDSPHNDDNSVWISVKTFFSQETKVSDYLKKHGTHHFIPTVVRYSIDKDGKRLSERVPAIHDLLFVRLDQGISQVKNILDGCPYGIYVYRHPEQPQQWGLIPERDMRELRLICDADYSDVEISEPQFITSKESNIKVGRKVRVVRGALMGVTGKLIRKNKKYYLVRTFGDLGFMVKVSRWCCESVEE